MKTLSSGDDFILQASSIPTAPRKAINDVLPALINGKGKPVGGIEPVTTAMLISVWTPINAVIPVAR